MRQKVTLKIWKKAINFSKIIHVFLSKNAMSKIEKKTFDFY